MDFVVSALVCWFLVSFAIKFIESYGEIEKEYEENSTPKYVSMQISVERIKEMWYGWFIDPETENEVFVAQGETCNLAISNCVDRIRQKNPEYTVLFKFRVKYDDQSSIQGQAERHDSQ